MARPDQQYFASAPQSASAPRPFDLTWRGRSYRFLTDSGVFSKGELDTGTQVLLNALPGHIAGDVLDLGCGWGPVGILLAAQHPDAQLTLADVNERAVSLARQNAAANGVKVRVVLSDGFAQLPGAFDLIALNPPIRAGKQVVYCLFDECREHLAPGGALYVVIRKQQGADSAKKHLLTLFPSVETVARKGGFHVFECTSGAAHAV